VRMTDFENKEAILRVYDVLDKMWIIKDLEKKLASVCVDEEIDNSFFFEGSDASEIHPKVMIAGKEIPLDKLKYDL
jgi:hypothetical protein